MSTPVSAIVTRNGSTSTPGVWCRSRLLTSSPLPIRNRRPDASCRQPGHHRYSPAENETIASQDASCTTTPPTGPSRRPACTRRTVVKNQCCERGRSKAPLPASNTKSRERPLSRTRTFSTLRPSDGQITRTMRAPGSCPSIRDCSSAAPRRPGVVWTDGPLKRTFSSSA